MLCKELRKQLLDKVHPEAKAMFRDSLRGKVAKTYRTLIIEAYPVHFWWIKTQSFLESEPGPISAWDLSDGYKFPGFPCQPSSLPAHCGKSLTYIPMVPGWLPPANIITSACKVSILLRHPIPAHLNTVVRCTTSRRKWFSVIQPNSLTCWFQGHPRSTPIHLSKRPLLGSCSLSQVTPIFQTCYLFPHLPDFVFTVSLSFWYLNQRHDLSCALYRVYCFG